MTADSATPTPYYDERGLACVLPSVARSLAPAAFPEARSLDPAKAAIVVLADGLGARLLARRGGHAPFLRSTLSDMQTLAAGFPTTTATSMGTFGTGLPPGAHGLAGYQVMNPATERVFNELSWEDGPDPKRWQPNATIFERADAAGLRPAMIGLRHFENSGLTNAALRGAKFFAAKRPHQRVQATLSALRSGHRLVYLYWPEIDKCGHEFGVDSYQWGDALEEFDAAFADLARMRPAGTSLTLTADHGMVDVPFDARIDVAAEPHLLDGVYATGGEMRAMQLFVRPGALDDVLAAWRDEIGSDGHVMTRDELADSGWVGAIDADVAQRFGDILVTMTGNRGFIDSRVMNEKVLSLIGQHGALTADELEIPFIHLSPR